MKPVYYLLPAALPFFTIAFNLSQAMDNPMKKPIKSKYVLMGTSATSAWIGEYEVQQTISGAPSRMGPAEKKKTTYVIKKTTK